MIQADKTGKIAGIGYQPGKSATLVRNPQLEREGRLPSRVPRPDQLQHRRRLDRHRPADAQGLAHGQLDTPTHPIVKLAYQQYPSQITFTPGSGNHYLRSTRSTACSRTSTFAVRCGPRSTARRSSRPAAARSWPSRRRTSSTRASSASSRRCRPGPAVDYNKNVNGNLAVAEKYMKAAGYPQRQVHRQRTAQIVVDQQRQRPGRSRDRQTRGLTAIGFKPTVSLVDQSVMYSKYCGVPKQEIDACPTVGWIRDFADPLSLLYPTFYGPAIVPTNNSNWGQVNDPTINAAMVKAARVRDPARALGLGQRRPDARRPGRRRPGGLRQPAQHRVQDVAGVNKLWNEG